MTFLSHFTIKSGEKKSEPYQFKHKPYKFIHNFFKKIQRHKLIFNSCLFARGYYNP